MHVVVAVSHRHCYDPRDSNMPNPSGRITEEPVVLGNCKHTGGWSWELRHTLGIHTDDQRSSEKNKLHIFCPLHLTDTIERRHQSRRDDHALAAPRRFLRPPRNLVSLIRTRTHLHAQSWRRRNIPKGTGKETQTCSQKCPIMLSSLTPSSHLQQALIVYFQGYADLACRTSNQHATYKPI